MTDLINLIPNKQSKSDDWINFHKEMMKEIGIPNANTIFLIAWKERGGFSPNDADLRSHLEKFGIVLNGQVWGASAIADTTKKVISTFEGIFGFGLTTMKVVTIVGLGMVGLLVFNIIIKPSMYSNAVGVASGTALKTFI